jgi:hypothetical protein
MVQTRDPATGQNILNGGVQVIQAIPGTLKVYILDPDDADAANVDAERIQDVTGFKAFRVVPLTPGAVAGVLAIIYGWSTSAGDLTAVNVAMAALDVDITTPGGSGQANDGANAIFPIGTAVNTQHDWAESPWVVAASASIKTIAVRATGGNYTVGVRVEVIA